MTAYDDSRVTEFGGPLQVLVGDGSVRRVGELMARWAQARTVLLVVDAQLLQLELVSPVIESLESAGFPVEVFGEVSREPDVSTAERVAELARARQITGVVGFGGGSSLDLAKIAAAAATNNLPVADFVGVSRLSEEPQPMVLIPTTAGTGSEATRVAMLSVDGKKRIMNDHRLVPQGAILDATLVVSLPPAPTAATGLDALSHAAEAFLSRDASPVTESMSREAVRLLSGGLRRAFRDGSDLQARRATLYGAHIAGRALSAGSVLGHSIAYTIANRAHLAHGVTCAMALPFCLAYGLSDGEVARRLDSLAGEVEEKAVRSGVDLLRWLEQLNRELEVPESLKAVGIEEGEVEPMAQECLTLYPRPNNPVPLESNSLTEMYLHLWRGDMGGYLELAQAKREPAS
ncbi:MAG: iron-containing alcohol dehydrogenase family protein [Acidimicrobiia bacterium]